MHVKKQRCLGGYPKFETLFQAFLQISSVMLGKSCSSFLASPKRGMKIFPFPQEDLGPVVVMTRGMS